jgi:hypothetical protein
VVPVLLQELIRGTRFRMCPYQLLWLPVCTSAFKVGSDPSSIWKKVKAKGSQVWMQRDMMPYAASTS